MIKRGFPRVGVLMNPEQKKVSQVALLGVLSCPSLDAQGQENQGASVQQPVQVSTSFAPRNGMAVNRVMPRSLIYVNGIQTSPEEARDKAQQLADFYGSTTTLFYNPMRSPISDGLTAYRSLRSPEAGERYEPYISQLKERLLAELQDPRQPVIHLHGHSEGGIGVANALYQVRREYEKKSTGESWESAARRIQVNTYGTPMRYFPVSASPFSFETDPIVMSANLLPVLPLARYGFRPEIINEPLDHATLSMPSSRAHSMESYIKEMPQLLSRKIQGVADGDPMATAKAFSALIQNGEVTANSADSILQQMLLQSDEETPGELYNAWQIQRALQELHPDGWIGDYALPENPLIVHLQRPNPVVMKAIEVDTPARAQESLARLRDLNKELECKVEALDRSLPQEEFELLEEEVRLLKISLQERMEELREDIREGLKESSTQWSLYQSNDSEVQSDSLRALLLINGHYGLAEKLQNLSPGEDPNAIVKSYANDIHKAQKFRENVHTWQAWGNVAAELISFENPKEGSIINSAVNAVSTGALSFGTQSPIAYANFALASIQFIGALSKDEGQQQKAMQAIFNSLSAIHEQLVEHRNDFREFRREVHQRFDRIEDRLLAISDTMIGLSELTRSTQREVRSTNRAVSRLQNSLNAFRGEYEVGTDAQRTNDQEETRRPFEEVREREIPFLTRNRRSDAIDTIIDHAITSSEAPCFTGSDISAIAPDGSPASLAALSRLSPAEMRGFLERASQELLRIPEEERLALLNSPGRRVRDFTLAAINPEVFCEGTDTLLRSDYFSDLEPSSQKKILDVFYQIGQRSLQLDRFFASPEVLSKAFEVSDQQLSRFIQAVRSFGTSDVLRDELRFGGPLHLMENLTQFDRSSVRKTLFEERPLDREQNRHQERVVFPGSKGDRYLDVDRRLFNDLNFETRRLAAISRSGNKYANRLRTNIHFSIALDDNTSDYRSVHLGNRSTKVLVGHHYRYEPSGGAVGSRAVRVNEYETYSIDCYRVNHLYKEKVQMQLRQGGVGLACIESTGVDRGYRYREFDRHHRQTGDSDSEVLGWQFYPEFTDGLASNWQRQKHTTEEVTFRLQDMIRKYCPGRNLRSVEILFDSIPRAEAKKYFPTRRFDSEDGLSAIVKQVDISFELSEEEAQKQGRIQEGDLSAKELSRKLVGECFSHYMSRYQMTWLLNEDESDALFEPHQRYLDQMRTQATPLIAREVERDGSELAQALAKADGLSALYAAYLGVGVPEEAYLKLMSDQDTQQNSLPTPHPWELMQRPGSEVRAIVYASAAAGRGIQEVVEELEGFQANRRQSHLLFINRWATEYENDSSYQYGDPALHDILERIRKRRQALE